MMDLILKGVLVAALTGVIAGGQPTPATAQAPSDVLSRAASQLTPMTAPWSIAGVSLGMSPQAVGTALKAAGYKFEYRYMGRSWQGEVANKVSHLRGIRIPDGAQVVRKEDYRKGQEFIQVDYAASPAGPYVYRVIYEISENAIDAERFRAAALGRYGRPSLKWDLESLYCVEGEPVCERTGSLGTNQLPNLTVYILGVRGRSLELRQGERAEKAYEAAVKAEAERLYPKKDKPSF
jgi:hypothetical protein